MARTFPSSLNQRLFCSQRGILPAVVNFALVGVTNSACEKIASSRKSAGKKSVKIKFGEKISEDDESLFAEKKR